MATERAPEDFERLYRRHVHDVYRYALVMVRDPADAEDLTQTTFLRAWRAFRGGVQPRTPQNWFLRIAHNVARTHFRERSRRPREVALPEGLEAAPPAGPTATDVLDALAELPVTQREALVMRELEGRSYLEIAAILGVSRSAVEALIFRARRSLRVRRADLRRLGAVPLPASLASFARERGVIETLGGVLATGAAAKAAAVVAAGVVAAGIGKEAADAVADEEPARPPIRADSAPKRPDPVTVPGVRLGDPPAAPPDERVPPAPPPTQGGAPPEPPRTAAAPTPPVRHRSVAGLTVDVAPAPKEAPAGGVTVPDPPAATVPALPVESPPPPELELPAVPLPPVEPLPIGASFGTLRDH